MLVRLGAVLVCLALSHCASVSTEECTRGDWTQIGYRDGSTGALREIISSHHKACAEVRVRPDPVAWERGYERGLLVYCTPEKGFSEGLANSSYRGVCPPHAEPGFLLRHAQGSEIYRARQEVRRYESEISSLTSRLRKSDLTPQQHQDLTRRLASQRRLRDDAQRRVQWAEAQALR